MSRIEINESTNMALNTSTIPRTFEHLSIPDPSWLQIAAKQQVIDKLADVLYSLPLDEFRKVAYKPPPLPADAPVIGGDIDVEHTKITTRDGTRIGLRIYRPIDHGSNHLLLFNIHGGGRSNSRQHLALCVV